MDNLIGLLLIALISKVFAQITLTPVLSFDPPSETPLKLNAGDVATLSCVVTSSFNFIAATDTVAIYKNQEDSWIKLASDESIEDGFDRSKFTLEKIYDKMNSANVVNIKVTINSIDVTDTGDYKCVGGVKDDDSDEYTMFNSGYLSVIVVAEKGELLDFNTKAPMTEPKSGRYVFNEVQEVSCVGTATTTNSALGLKVTLAGGDITNYFKPNTEITWTGEEGRKTPTQRVSLTKDDYIPDMTGDARLSCYLGEEEMPLQVQHLDIRRDEPKVTATMQCGNNLEKEAYAGQLDVVINCTVHDFTGDSSKLTVRWELIHDNCTAPVTIYTGASKYSLVASANDDKSKHKMTINSISKVLVSCGARSPCSATLVEKDKEEETIAKADCSFNIDTKSLMSNGSIITASWVLIISSLCQSLF